MKALHQQIEQETLQQLTPVLSALQLKKFQILQKSMHGRFHHHGGPPAAASAARRPELKPPFARPDAAPAGARSSRGARCLQRGSSRSW